VVFGFCPGLAVAAGPEYNIMWKVHWQHQYLWRESYTQFVLIQDLNNIIPAGIHIGFFLHAEDELQSLQTKPVLEQYAGDNRQVFSKYRLIGAGISQRWAEGSTQHNRTLGSGRSIRYIQQSGDPYQLHFLTRQPEQIKLETWNFQSFPFWFCYNNCAHVSP